MASVSRVAGLVALALALVSVTLGAPIPISSTDQVPAVRPALPPIVFVPGLSGSSLEARLSDPKDVPHPYCTLTTDWFRIWVRVPFLLPGLQDCFFDYFAVRYNDSSNSFSTRQGVEIRPMDFGGFEGVTYLDKEFDIPIPLSEYMNQFLKRANSVGYVAGENIHAATYDWRLSPSGLEQNGYFEQVRQLIEQTYEYNNNTRVHTIGHSSGATILLHFLNLMTAEWKAKYISSYFALGGPFAGATETLSGLISGGSLVDLPKWVPRDILPRQKIRALAQTFGGILWNLPIGTTWDNITVISTPTEHYTSANITELLNIVKADVALAHFSKVKKNFEKLSSPGVRTFCIYGTERKTPLQYNYSNSKFDEDPQVVFTDGDGTVTLNSLRQCARLAREQPQPVTTHEYPQMEHRMMIKDERLLDMMFSVMLAGDQAK